MRTLIVVYSYHHMNTLKIAHAMAEVLDATVKSPEQTRELDLSQYDRIGFGAGIDSGKHYQSFFEIPGGNE